MSLTVIGNGAAPAAAVPGQSQQLADPFDVLLRANNVVLTSLRRDEATPELQKQLTQTGMPSSAQAYFCDPYSNCYLGPQVCLPSVINVPFVLSLSPPLCRLLRAKMLFEIWGERFVRRAVG